MSMPSPPKPFTTRPSIVEPEEPDASVRPLAPLPAEAPEMTTSGTPENPGSVFPSMSTGTVIAGRGDASVIVCDARRAEVKRDDIGGRTAGIERR